MRRWAGALLVAAALALPGRSVLADDVSDRAAIIRALEDWAAAFNAGDHEAVCDLFAPDLVATARGAPDRGKVAQCAILRAALARDGRRLTYTPTIHEVILAGDLAVVRLDWRLSIQAGASESVVEERGVDVFRRQPDGRWRIARFMVFERP